MEKRAYKLILVEARAGVCTLTLNRPERRNAIGAVMANELLYALDDAHVDTDVRCVVLTGAGQAFCAGGDFSQMTGQGDADALPPKGDYKDLLLALLNTTKPVLARVNGHAMGGGLGLVAASTFAVASSEAKLGTPEINVGLFPYMIMAVLERLVGRRRLTEMFLSGERMSAAQAAELQLVNRAVPPEQLDAAVAEYTRMICDKSPKSIELGLRAMRETEGLTLEQKLPLLSQRLLETLATEDAQEGLMAFLQKREPRWKGR